MSIKRSIKLVRHALKQEQKDKLWDIYVQKVPYMDENNYILFEEFWKKTHIKIDQTSKEETLKMAENIRKKSKKKNRQERR
jgi:hypothetical protein